LQSGWRWRATCRSVAKRFVQFSSEKWETNIELQQYRSGAFAIAVVGLVSPLNSPFNACGLRLFFKNPEPILMGFL
jgi:hypothetical protein